jgi:hypothetical protein
MAIAGLVLWALTLLMGIVVLTVWLRKRRAGSRFPTVVVILHIVTALLGLYFWIGFVVDGQAKWAWITFVIMNVNNLLGDAILTGRFRALSGTIGSWWRDYGQAVRSLLRGERPRPATLHATLAGATYVVVLIGAVQASL